MTADQLEAIIRKNYKPLAQFTPSGFRERTGFLWDTRAAYTLIRHGVLDRKPLGAYDDRRSHNNQFEYVYRGREPRA